VIAVWIVVSLTVVGIMLIIAVLGGHIEWMRRDPSLDVRARVALHGARRRLEVTQMRSAFKADGARIRRDLHRELRDIDRRDGA